MAQQLRPSQTKIVATVGPACDAPACLEAMIRAGVDVFRLNAAHGTRGDLQARLDRVREAGRSVGQPVGVLLDLAGPKMRLGELTGGQLQLGVGDTLRFVRNGPTKPTEVTTTYEPLIDELSVGDRVMLADGTVSLTVQAKGPDWADCRVVQPGIVRSRQGVNLPGVKLSAEALSDSDRENALWAVAAGVDFLGLSFVRSPDDIRQLRTLLGKDGDPAAGGPQIVAKIEKPEALEHLAEIVALADGVMVARGDLGVEIDIARISVVQKEIVALCNRLHKPVIVATQMLESMQHSRLPTRAEVTDVANAILDGTDACMLSGETAVGEYPVQAVEMMHRIALATEPLARERPRHGWEMSAQGVHPITEAVTHAAGRMAEDLGAKLVVVATHSGRTALSVSKNRGFVPTVGVSREEATLRRMALYWSVIPLPGVPADDRRQLLAHVEAWAKSVEMVAAGDRIVLITGTGLASTAHNSIVVHLVEG